MNGAVRRRSPIAAVVLAAGTSSRLGAPKQLLLLDGQPVLQHVVDVARDCFDCVVVVLGHAAEDVRRAVRFPSGTIIAVNKNYADGQASSLAAGLAAVPADADAAAILLGDQPRIDRDVVDRVVEAFERSGKPVARPGFGGTPGHPVIMARRVFERAARARGDEGARAVFAADEVARVDIDADAPVDIDTWDAYERLAGG